MPYGARSLAQDSMFRASGMMDFNRSIVSNTEGEPQNFANPYAIKIHFILNNGSTLAAMKSRLDSIVVAQTTGVVLVHDLCTACALTSTLWLSSDFQAFIDYALTYVQAGTLKIQNLGDYVEKYGGGFSRRHRAGVAAAGP
jgi:hypothetical protein